MNANALPVTARFATRMSRMLPSAVREILKVAESPDILSFAGGLPAPELFPVVQIADAHARVLRDHGGAALQYSTTEGYAPLRAWIAAHLCRQGVTAAVDRVLITNGSQQGIDLVARIFCNPGDRILVENPSYLAALQAFAAYEVELLPVASDNLGMCPDSFEELARRQRPKIAYLVPNFQNPKGATLALDRRQRIAAAAARYDVTLLEDDPYGELVFRGQRLPAIATYGGDNVVHLGTFSKTLAPGLRIGWVCASPRIVEKLTIVKQAADLHTATLSQRATAALLEAFDYAGHVQELRRVYGERCDTMLSALTAHMPAGTQWQRPDGGMFVWMRLPNSLDADTLFSRAIEERVAFVPGSGFFVGPAPSDFVRLNFSNRPPQLIQEGIARLGRVVSQALPLRAG